MAPGRKKLASSAASSPEKEWEVGDLVLAKLRGYPAWPAKVSAPEKHKFGPKERKVFVEYFGSGEVGFVQRADVSEFTPDVRAACNEKAKMLTGRLQSSFRKAVRQICEFIDRSKVKNTRLPSEMPVKKRMEALTSDITGGKSDIPAPTESTAVVDDTVDYSSDKGPAADVARSGAASGSTEDRGEVLDEQTSDKKQYGLSNDKPESGAETDDLEANKGDNRLDSFACLVLDAEKDMTQNDAVPSGKEDNAMPTSDTETTAENPTTSTFENLQTVAQMQEPAKVESIPIKCPEVGPSQEATIEPKILRTFERRKRRPKKIEDSGNPGGSKPELKDPAASGALPDSENKLEKADNKSLRNRLREEEDLKPRKNEKDNKMNKANNGIDVAKREKHEDVPKKRKLDSDASKTAEVRTFQKKQRVINESYTRKTENRGDKQMVDSTIRKRKLENGSDDKQSGHTDATRKRKLEDGTSKKGDKQEADVMKKRKSEPGKKGDTDAAKKRDADTGSDVKRGDVSKNRRDETQKQKVTKSPTADRKSEAFDKKKTEMLGKSLHAAKKVVVQVKNVKELSESRPDPATHSSTPGKEGETNIVRAAYEAAKEMKQRLAQKDETPSATLKFLKAAAQAKNRTNSGSVASSRESPLFMRPKSDTRKASPQQQNGDDKHVRSNKDVDKVTKALETFQGMLERLTGLKESITRTTRVAVECANKGYAKKVMELIMRKLKKERDHRKRVNLLFLVDSMTQFNYHKGTGRQEYAPIVEAYLSRFLSAVAPPNSPSENHQQCVKVLKVWLERKLMQETLLKNTMAKLVAGLNTTQRQYQRPDRAIDDPLREMDDMLVDEYGSNTSFQLPGFLARQAEEEDMEGKDEPAAASPENKHAVIMEDLDGELEMEDASPTATATPGDAPEASGKNGSSSSTSSLTRHDEEDEGSDEDDKEEKDAVPLPASPPPSPPPLPESPPPSPPPRPPSSPSPLQPQGL